MDSKPPKKKKEDYEAPKLRVIELLAEEVMGLACKQSSTVGWASQLCIASLCATSLGAS